MDSRLFFEFLCDNEHTVTTSMNFDGIIKTFENAENDSYSMNCLGYIYRIKYKDYEKAKFYFLKAVELNNATAMNNLGIIYYRNYNNTEEAIKLYTKSIETGNKNASFNLGNLYFDKKEYGKSLEYFLKAREMKYTKEIRSVGFIYSIYKDYKKAEEWYLQEIELGNMYALLKLGNLYINDYKDYKKAYEFLSKIQSPDCKIKKLLSKCENNLKMLNDVYADLKTDDCSVCYNKLLGTNSSVMVLLCGHMFHNNCLEGITICPLCRVKINK